jgi:heme A synthase
VNEPRKTNIRFPARRWILLAIVFTLSLAIIQALIGWAVGYQTSAKFSNIYFITGSVLCLLGLLSAFFRPRFSNAVDERATAQDSTPAPKSSSWLTELRKGYNTMIILVISGALFVGLSALVALIH